MGDTTQSRSFIVLLCVDSLSKAYDKWNRSLNRKCTLTPTRRELCTYPDVTAAAQPLLGHTCGTIAREPRRNAARGPVLRNPRRNGTRLHEDGPIGLPVRCNPARLQPVK